MAEDEAESPEALVTVLLCLDAGLRIGEALAVTWGDIVWGDGEDDRARRLRVSKTRSRGGAPTAPQNSEERDVALSRRLRRALITLYRKRFNPSPEAQILDGVEPNNFRHREWRRICQRAGVGHQQLKSLRHSFASWLLTVGVNPAWVSRQLGHSDWNVTAKHYAKHIERAAYEEPLTLETGEVHCDFFARLPKKSPPLSPHHTKTGTHAIA